MNIKRKYTPYICALFLSLNCSLLFSSENLGDFNLVEVEKDVFVHQGKHVSIEADGHDDIANIGFIVGDKCIAVIDTGGSVMIGKRFLNKIRSISSKPICYVINTHIHFDHILGNKAFSMESARFVGHYQLAEEIEQNRAFFLEQFRDDLGPKADAKSIIGPDALVEDTLQLDLGNRPITLKAFPVSHSHSDLIVIDDKTKTLWSGDLIFRERIPSLTGSLIGWVEVMSSLQNLDVKKVIPGHGSVANSLSEALAQQQDYLSRLLNETRKSIAEGQFINDAIVTIDKDNQSGFVLHEYQHQTNVSRAYTELEWE